MTTISKNTINNIDCICGLRQIDSCTSQIIICDPPYNIGKDFGNNSDNRSLTDYLEWCKLWISECFRILNSDGTLYIYGFSENLAYIRTLIDSDNYSVRWLVWHYTNKNVPSLKFWQRSHESILCCWKKSNKYPHFNIDDIREPYTKNFISNSAGKIRTNTLGRFSNGENKTVYNAHEKGALPRDTIKIPALAGGAGKNERVNHPTQKPLELCLHLLKASKKNNSDLVIIPFAGSGSECLACKKLELPFIGFEINEEYIKICNERLEM